MLLGHGVAVCAAVAWTSADDSLVVAAATTIASLVAAGLAAFVAARVVPRPRLALLGMVLAGAGLTLVGVTPRGVITVNAAFVLGAGVGLASPRRDDLRAALGAAGALAGASEAVLVGALLGRTAALRFAFVLVAVMGAAALLDRRGEVPRPNIDRRARAFSAVIVVLAIGLVAWVGANDPTVAWYGHITTHGDRGGDRVALTFDDGPDAEWSLKVAAILDAHSAKGTFFEVGKAVDARPDITKALYDDGQLLGNHSYRHDYTGWLDPRYPELGETQQAFGRALGVCPALFRPPHGQRTPFMLAHVADRGMHTVTWDTSAKDWVDHDGRAVAARILDQVRPGSIILLHDGLDGNVVADRSVLEVALPLILDGLAAKGLHPVRLDELLGIPAYLPHC